jgi:Uma2 family endonuclease
MTDDKDTPPVEGFRQHSTGRYPMTAAALTVDTSQISVEHGRWTEEEYLELGETPDRIELFDGSLFVSPSPTPIHQDVSGLLLLSMRPRARVVGLHAYLAVNVRLKTDRILIPDLVIVDPVDPRGSVMDASSVRLVCEITSPSNAANDRLLKMHHYAEAGIPWYLLVDTDPEMVLRLFRLEGDHYLRHAEGRAGHPLLLTEPIRVDLDPATFDV